MKKRNRVLALTVAAAMSASLLAGCGSSAQQGGAASSEAASTDTAASVSDGGEDNIIRVGVVCSMTGGSAIYGEGAQNAVDMAVEEINAGDSGYKIEIVNGGKVADDAKDAKQAMNAYNKVMADSPEAIVGSFFSSVTLPMAEQASKDGMLLLATGATNADVTLKGDSIFRNCFIDPYHGKMAALFAKDKGFAKVAVIYAKGDDYSNGLKDAFVENCEAKKNTKGDVTMPSIDLNCDLGESFGAYTIGMDAEILPYVTSANIACGFHAGDPSVMQKSVLLCKKYGVQVGAHPGLPDLQGFGRRRMAISPAEAEADVMYQIGALKAFCDAAGVPLHRVKPHGALYNMAARDPVLAAAICRAVQAAAPGAVLLALSGSEMVKAANAIGLPVASEVFADRGYQADGSLVPRGAPGAMIENEDTAIAQVLQMAAQGTVQADDGSTVTLQADSVCIHGDGPKALAFV